MFDSLPWYYLSDLFVQLDPGMLPLDASCRHGVCHEVYCLRLCCDYQNCTAERTSATPDGRWLLKRVLNVLDDRV